MYLVHMTSSKSKRERKRKKRGKERERKRKSPKRSGFSLQGEKFKIQRFQQDPPLQGDNSQNIPKNPKFFPLGPDQKTKVFSAGSLIKNYPDFYTTFQYCFSLTCCNTCNKKPCSTCNTCNTCNKKPCSTCNKKPCSTCNKKPCSTQHFSIVSV